MSTSPDDPLEELSEQTAETLADARKEVDRARRTLHDQVMPATSATEEWDSRDQSADPEPDGDPSAGSDPASDGRRHKAD